MRHRNLQQGDICLLLYESKIVANYRLCRVIEAVPSNDGRVRTVTVGYLPRKSRRQVVYHPVPLESKEVYVQRLVLILPVEEQLTTNDQAAQSEPEANYSELSLVRAAKGITDCNSGPVPATNN